MAFPTDFLRLPGQLSLADLVDWTNTLPSQRNQLSCPCQLEASGGLYELKAMVPKNAERL
jgi:hypothetical protein